MVLTSTSYVAPHIAPCISSVVICLTQVELQMVLISTVSTSILSSVVAILVASKRRPQRPRSPRPSPPLHLQTAATKQLAARKANRLSRRTSCLSCAERRDSGCSSIVMTSIVRCSVTTPAGKCQGKSCAILVNTRYQFRISYITCDIIELAVD